MKEKTLKYEKFSPVAAGAILLLSVIIGAVGDFIRLFFTRGDLLNLDFLAGFLVVLTAIACAATYFEKKVAFGAAGMFAVIAVTYFFGIFNTLIAVLKSVTGGWFSFEYLLGTLVGIFCSLLAFVGFAAMAALVIMVLIKYNFKYLNYWYAPAAAVLLSLLISSAYTFISMIPALEYYSWDMGIVLTWILFILSSAVGLVSTILVPAGMALYARYIYQGAENTQIDVQ